MRAEKGNAVPQSSHSKEVKKESRKVAKFVEQIKQN